MDALSTTLSTTLSPVTIQPDVGRTDRPPADATREAFDDFFGQTFFGQMLKAMRSTVGKAPYFHGGQAEEVFRGQLDQMLAEKMSDASAKTFTDPMYELFTLTRK